MSARIEIRAVEGFGYSDPFQMPDGNWARVFIVRAGDGDDDLEIVLIGCSQYDVWFQMSIKKSAEEIARHTPAEEDELMGGDPGRPAA